MLTVVGTLLALPILGMYYGLHEWTAAHTGGVVDARFIALIDTALESPLGQIAMIPMLAWIAQLRAGEPEGDLFRGDGLVHQPGAVGLAARHEYLNRVFVVTRGGLQRARRADDRAAGRLLVPLAAVAAVRAAAPENGMKLGRERKENR